VKVFLQLLLYLVCSECRIENGPIEQLSYSDLGSGVTDDMYKNFNPVVIKDLNDYKDFYRDYYGTYPPYTEFDFTKNMIVFFFVSSNNSIEIGDVYETNEQISINMYHPRPSGYRLYSASLINDPKTYFMAISLKHSDKVVKVYN
jgi:hypothetical protein